MRHLEEAINDLNTEWSLENSSKNIDRSTEAVSNNYQKLYSLLNPPQIIKNPTLEKILMLRDKLCLYDNILNELPFQEVSNTKGYYSKDIMTSKMRSAFSGNNKFALIQNRPLNEAKIYSFSQQCFMKMLSTNWLYPIKVDLETIEDKGSLNRTLKGKAIRSKFTLTIKKVPKLIRYAFKMGAHFAIALTAAPLGVLYNALKTVFYTATYFFQQEGRKASHLDIIIAYSKATFYDLYYIPMGFVHGICQNKWHLIAPEEIRKGIAKSFRVRKLGFTGPKGRLLSFNSFDKIKLSEKDS